jgi:HAE1 family hydrophobic/amphiphilic exporter-1
MENIYRNLEKGVPIKEAAINGTAEVGGAITASTITTVVVFLPIIYLHGEAGELFKDQAWTVAFSLISSLFVAILVIPVLSVRFLENSGADKINSGISFQWYRPLLQKILQRRKTVLISAALLIIGAALLIPVIGSEFMPKSDSGSFQIKVALEEGSALEYTNRAVMQLEKIIKTIAGDDIASIYSRVGPVSGELCGQSDDFLDDENRAEILVNLKAKRKHTSGRIIDKLNAVFKEIPDMVITFNREQSTLQATLGNEEAPVVVEIKGEDLTVIRELSAKAAVEMNGVKDLTNIETTFDEGRPEINIKLDRIRAGIYNIDFASVGSQLKDYLQGKEAGSWDNNGEIRDITIRLPEIGLNELRELKITNGEQEFRLGDIADIEQVYAQKEILHHNQTRIAKITAEIKNDRPLDKIAAEIKTRLKNVYFPEGYQYQISGEEALREQSFSSLKFALLLSIILIYMVMASQFESLIHPFTILLTLPLAGVGAVLVFFILGMSLNVMAYIGIIMLMGIAVNDSIILVDAINHLKREGWALNEAILEAGQRRIRPIIMTSLTTILALFPLTLGIGESAALRSPMALAVIGGLITSTLLTLAVIPCLYYVFERK